MTKNLAIKPLGLVLRKAGLVSSQQIEQALQESLNLPQCRIGEILAIRGWIHPQTANFFAEIWPRVLIENSKLTNSNSPAQVSQNPIGSKPAVNSQKRSPLGVNGQESVNPNTHQNVQDTSAKVIKPLGQYLQAAKLLDRQQIACILQLQARDSAKFGKIAVEQGFISQITLEYFLEHLYWLKSGIELAIYPESTALEIDRVENYLLDNRRCQSIDLLQKYQAIYQQGSIVATGDDTERELLASGIVILKQGNLRVAKPEYRETFDQEWLDKELANLQPYNQIRFKMFSLRDKVDTPYKITNAINYWCDRQPFLTQKLYLLVQGLTKSIIPGEEERIIEELVYRKIINNWQQGMAKEHFYSISDRIKQNDSCSAVTLLQTYKKIWQLKEVKYEVASETGIAQQELLRLGLLKLRHGRLRISNRIYQAVLDLSWVEQQLAGIVSEEVAFSQTGSARNTSKNRWQLNQATSEQSISNRPERTDVTISPEATTSEAKTLVKQGHRNKSLLPLILLLLTLLTIPIFYRVFANFRANSLQLNHESLEN